MIPLLKRNNFKSNLKFTILPVILILSIIFSLNVSGEIQKIVLVQKDIITLNRIDTLAYPTIFLNVIVTDRDGNPKEGLGVKDFTVIEDGIKQEIDDVLNALQKEEPLNLMLTMDVSGSMGEENIISETDDGSEFIRPIDKAKEAAKNFVSRLNSKDKVIVSGFADYWLDLNEITEDRSVITDSIDRLEAEGGTALFEAVIESVNKMKDLEGNKSVIVLTDGKDTGINMTLDDCLSRVKSKGVPVFTIGLGPDIEEDNLIAISEMTGGRYFKASDSLKLDKIYELISRQLERQYWIKYKIKKSHPIGAPVEVTVKSLFPGVQGISKLVYITPPQLFERIVHCGIGLIAVIMLTIMFFQLFWKGFGVDPVISTYISILISGFLFLVLFTFLFLPVFIYYNISLQVFLTLGVLSLLVLIFIIWRIKEYA